MNMPTGWEGTDHNPNTEQVKGSPNTDPTTVVSRAGKMKVLDADARIFLYEKFLSEGDHGGM